VFNLTLLLAALSTAPQPAKAPPPPTWLKDLTVRPGYTVSLAASDVSNLRHVESDGASRLFVSRPYAPPPEGQRRSTNGDILCLRDRDGDGFYEWRETFVTGPVTLHGLCFVQDSAAPGKPALPGAGWLWYSTSGSIWKARDNDGDGKADENIEVLKDGSLPSGGANWWRAILVTESRLFTAIGDTANITDESDTDRQKIWSFALDGSDKKLFASGLRSTEKLRLRPTGKPRPPAIELWGVDQGSDWFGRILGEKPGQNPDEPGAGQPMTETLPPDEINVYTESSFYGHPFLVGDRIPRPEFAAKSDLADWAARTTSPKHSLPAHAGASGFCFLDPDITSRLAARPGALPNELGGLDLVVACHGSWNTPNPAGYSIERVLFDPVEDRPIGHVTLVRGIRRTEDPATKRARWTPLIRPVDIVQAADGSLLFTCDMNNMILRISGVRKP
jgi:glucose/arabinose dehydrogenase